MVLGNCHSTPWPLASRVSVIAHVFAYLHKTAGEVARRYGIVHHQHADDTQLDLSLPSAPKEVVAILNLGLEQYWAA